MKRKKTSPGSRDIAVNILLAVIIAGLYLALILPYSGSSTVATAGYPIYKGSNREAVAIECAVCWDAQAIPEILDVLREHNVRITFAVSGEWAKQNGGLLRRMADEGHEIVTMGYAPSEDGRGAFIRNDIEKALDAIRSETGLTPEIYYCGSRNASVSASCARKLGLTMVKCTIDLACTIGTADDIIQRVNGHANGGDILLVEPTAAFLQALPDILALLTDRGLTPGTISSTIYD